MSTKGGKLTEAQKAHLSVFKKAWWAGKTPEERRALTSHWKRNR